MAKNSSRSSWRQPRRLILLAAGAALLVLGGWLLLRRTSIDRDRIYTITYGSDAPFHFRGPEGTPQGVAVDIVAEAARRAGIKLEWVYSGVRRNNDLLVLQTIRPDLRKSVHFSEPYLQTSTWFVVPQASGVDDFEDLENARVSYVNYGIHRINLSRLLPGMQRVPAETSREALENVLQGRADAAYVNEYALLSAFLAGGISRPLRIIPSQAPQSVMAIASSHALAAVVDEIRSEMSSMVDDGTIPNLIKRWGWFSNLTTDLVSDLVTAQRRHLWIQVSLIALSVVLLSGVLLAIRSRNQAIRLSRAEASLQEKDAWLNLLVEQAGDGIEVFDATGRYVEVNAAACRQLGYSKEELLQRRISDIDLSIGREDYTAVFQSLVGNPPRTFETVRRQRNGTTYSAEITLSTFTVGNVSRALALTRDITKRKQAEEKLHKQAALLDLANEAIYVRTLDHVVTYWNNGATRLYGWTASETVGRTVTELGMVDPVAFASAQASLLEHGSWTHEVKKRGKDGRERFVFCRWTLLRDDQGKAKEVLAINTDITEMKQLETNYLRAQRMEGIGMLAGGIAHDLNNILTPILLSTSILRDSVSDPESRELVEGLRASARRGSDIIRQLLTFARGRPNERAPVPVRQQLREMEQLIRETFPRNIRVQVNAAENLWTVVGDTTQVHQALMNLCVNARDAMPKGGILTLAADNVELDAAAAARMPDAKPGPHVRLSVTDNGTGISAPHLERIFDPFFTTKGVGKGTGLGLPSVMGIVRGHGGAVSVESQVGKGTTFELYFPASARETVVDLPATPSLPHGHGELVLVVDDEAAIRDAARRLLERHGYRVLQAAEGGEALALFEQHRSEIKVVLTDVMMPGMDGHELLKELRLRDPQLPVLRMTGLVEFAKMKELEAIDTRPLLHKPFELDQLLGAIHEALAAGSRTGSSGNSW